MDNSTAEVFVNDTAYKTMLKHIDVRQKWVQVLRNKSILRPVHVDTKLNIADLFTKILPKQEFLRLRDMAMKKRTSVWGGDLKYMKLPAQVPDLAKFPYFLARQLGNGTGRWTIKTRYSIHPELRSSGNYFPNAAKWSTCIHSKLQRTIIPMRTPVLKNHYKSNISRWNRSYSSQ